MEGGGGGGGGDYSQLSQELKGVALVYIYDLLVTKVTAGMQVKHCACMCVLLMKKKTSH